METLGDRIKRLREARHLSQDELGRLVGVTGAAVGMWETGATKNIKTVPLALLVRVLQTDLDYLVFGPDRKPPNEAAPGNARKQRS